MKNPYKVLGLEESATEEEIKKAYRKLSKETHPDRAIGDDEAKKKYLEVQEAYEQLTKPKQDNSFSFPGDFFEDIFSSFTNQSQRIQTVEISISFFESLYGVKKDIQFTTRSQCKTCSGNGNDPTTELKNCDVCAGLGRLSSRHGNTITSRTCGHCYGKGKIISKICGDCLGSGEISVNNSISIELPPGVFRGMRIKLTENVVGIVNVLSCEYYKRNNFDLLIDAQIPLSVALFGGEIDVKSSSGNLKVKIPQNSQPGMVLRIREQGFPDPERQELKGDLYIKINICLPENNNFNIDLIKEIENKSKMDSVKKFKEFHLKI